ncbi:MAG: hypothetical protein FK733_06345 [Asgard group archaeon]|nr:hypothetical protein [Asgard group archaeon]
MAHDIIKEQRLLRTLFYSLIQSVELIHTNKNQRKQFCNTISKFVRDRALIMEDTRDVREIITELSNSLGWKSIQFSINENRGVGKIILGKNRYFVNEVEEIEGTNLVLEAFFTGMCYHIFNSPVEVQVSPSFSSGSFYEISFKKSDKVEEPKIKTTTPVPKIESDQSIHSILTFETIFNPIFTRDIPHFILFEALWKVVSESYVANFSAIGDEEAKEILKNPSLENLSLLIMKLTDEQSEKDIQNMAEIVGEFFIKLLQTKVSDSLISKLQSTLQDRQASNYLIYYECRVFCADKKFINRCIFIRSMWLGILNEIFGFPIKVKELFHAGKRDRYCMIELVPDKQE